MNINIKIQSSSSGSATQKWLILILIGFVVLLGTVLLLPKQKTTTPEIPNQEQFKELKKTLADAFAAVNSTSAQDAQKYVDALKQLMETMQGSIKDLASQMQTNSAEKVRLESEVRHLNEELERLKRQVQQPSTGASDFTNFTVVPPQGGANPPAQGPDSSDKRGEDDGNAGKAFGQLADTVASGICLVKPPLCLVAMGISQILKSFGGLAGKEVLRTVEKYAKGMAVSPAELNTIRSLLTNRTIPPLAIPELRQRLQEMVDKGISKASDFVKILDDAMDQLLSPQGACLLKRLGKKPPQTKQEFDTLVQECGFPTNGKFPSEEAGRVALELWRKSGTNNTEAIKGWLEAMKP